MSDPLSIAASVVGILAFGVQSTEYLYNFYNACRERDKDLATISKQLGQLVVLIENVKRVISVRRWRTGEEEIIKSIEDTILSCRDVVQDLQKKVNELKKSPTDTWKDKIVKIGKQTAYPFKRSTLVKIEENVEDFQDNLSKALQVLELKEHQNTQQDVEKVNMVVRTTQNDIAGIATAVKNLHAANVSSDLRQWLRAPDSSTDYIAACKKRHQGTGQWLVRSYAFENWLRQENSFLWLYGFAGCGKSVLCSTAVQYVLEYQYLQQVHTIAYFFFTFRDEVKQDASAMLRAILLQLARQISGVEDKLKELQELYKHGMPPVLVLIECLREVVSQSEQVYIFLDALDECPSESKSGEQARYEVLSTIECMRGWNLPNLHLLVTSRDRDALDIRDSFQSMPIDDRANHIHLKNEHVQQDIALYVTYRVDHDQKLKIWSQPQQKIIKDYLTDHADGVFRWVDCQLQALQNCPRSEHYLRQCLAELPVTLDRTYERMLCSIKSYLREDARRLLSLLSFSLRPLTVNEVLEAMAVDSESGYQSDRRLADGNDLYHICSGLVDIDGVSFGNVDHNVGDSDSDGSHASNGGEMLKCSELSKYDHIHVRIAHFSVKEYLLSDRIQESQAKYFAMSAFPEHGQLSKSCLLYLENEALIRSPLNKNLVRQHALAFYAASCWYKHYLQTSPKLQEQLAESIVTFLSTFQKLDIWTSLHNPHETMPPGSYRTTLVGPDKRMGTATYYAALLGLDNVLTSILSRNSGNINTMSERYSTPLQAAVQRNHLETARILLDHNADLNEKDECVSVEQIISMTEACLAERYGDAGDSVTLEADYIKYIMVDPGLHWYWDLTHQCSPLYLAANLGYTRMVRLLLDRGAKVDASGGPEGTALRIASARGHLPVVELLLDRGAEIDELRKYPATALQLASDAGHIQVVELLLDRGAAINTSGTYGENALQSATATDRLQTVQLLLDRGADIDAIGFSGSAFEIALRNRDSKVLELLLRRGARTDTFDPQTVPQSCWFSKDGWREHCSNVAKLIQKYGKPSKIDFSEKAQEGTTIEDLGCKEN